MSWLDNVVVTKAIIQSKGNDKPKAHVKGKKKKLKKGFKSSKPTSSYCCGKVQTNNYKGTVYCGTCNRSVV